MNPENYTSEQNTIILPLDGLDTNEAFELIEEVRDDIWGVKAHDLIDEYGTGFIPTLREAGAKRVMSDPKLEDVPPTVFKRGMKHVLNGADYLTFHASGGHEMIKPLQTYLDENPQFITRLIGVTVLTSFSRQKCREIYGDDPEVKVKQFAMEAAEAGVWGSVSSPLELETLNSSRFTRDLVKVVPGIRMPDAKADHQSRKAPPYEAVKWGGNQLVIGTPILKPESGTRIEAVKLFLDEIKRAWGEIKMEESKRYKEIFQGRGALWHDSELTSPYHAKLAKGAHSNFFFNASKIITDPKLVEELFRSRSLNVQKYGKVDWVVGSAMGGITLAHGLARVLGCRCAFTEKLELLDARDREPLLNFLNSVEGIENLGAVPPEIVGIIEKLESLEGKNDMILKRFDDIKEGDTVLVCEDVCTTGGTTKNTIKAIEEKGANIIPEVVVVVCDRSDKESANYKLGDYEINSLVDFSPKTWDPDECEMCEKDSVPVKAKDNWNKLENS